ncbi:MAG: hypothetical protein SFU99_21195 [Saprospiraceae bacterium]|nr:hypothetical protein [Saprospiraceae bacterium]
MKKSVKPVLASKILYDNRNQQEYEKDIFMDFALRIGIKHFFIQQPQPPKPDIIISIERENSNKDFIIGCEIKDLYWDKGMQGSNEKRKFEKWKSFARRLRTDLDKLNNGFEYLYGVLTLKNFDILKFKENQEKLSEGIINFLKPYRLPINDQFDKFYSQTFLSENIANLRIETYAERGVLWWERSLRSGTAYFDAGIFNDEILQKSEKNHDFTECDEKWLLLFAESNNIGNTITFSFESEGEPKISVKHKFDRVFFFDYFQQKIYQIVPKFKRLFEVDKDGNSIRFINSLPKEIVSYNG